jgi:ubiquinone/menaquinone biosynthesis C-methylase UbiE
MIFDQATSRRLERMYAGRDIVNRRRLVRAALAAAPGERILDIGCGPGFYEAELVEEVGTGGSIVGVDASPDMLALARQRCRDYPNVEFLEGAATSPPVEDATFDGAVCVQVLEYVPDATAALAAMQRALKPGGRIVVWDTDFATMSWYSSDPERMGRVLKAYDDHLVHPSLPQTLSARLRAAGFDDVRVTGHCFTTTELSPETHGGAFLPLIAAYVPGHHDVTKQEAMAWEADQRDLDVRGQFFYTCSQFCFSATKPAEETAR